MSIKKYIYRRNRLLRVTFMASGGWRLRPHTPKTTPHCEFLARHKRFYDFLCTFCAAETQVFQTEY